uniref:Reverse transcriptase domain-containing protein n=1 Tax=Cannabis sativa TaxID=3483 RepID=A0A803Q154_CANSA
MKVVHQNLPGQKLIDHAHVECMLADHMRSKSWPTYAGHRAGQGWLVRHFVTPPKYSDLSLVEVLSRWIGLLIGELYSHVTLMLATWTCHVRCGKVIPKRGLRQGDPLSPFMFLFCAEAFSCLINKEEVAGRFHGLSFGRQGLQVSHLFFADDSLVFFDASLVECGRFKDLLDKYTMASGQAVNFTKSEMCFGALVDRSLRSRLAALLDVKVVNNYGKYLGLPSFFGRSKKELFEVIKNRVWQKVRGWKGSMFSVAGKEVLIKAILQAMPAYTMSCFQLPKSTIKSLHSMGARFWWGSSARQKKVHWCKWNYMCKPKEKGGLGFRDLGLFNQALLAKQVWRCLRSPTLLSSRVLKACYYPGVSVLDAKCGSHSSFMWRSMMWGKKLLLKGYRWRIGDGNGVRVLNDPWLPRPVTFCVYDRPEFPHELYVVDLKLADGGWDEGFIKAHFNEEDAELILNLPSGSWGVEDKIMWHYSKNGEYTVRSGYRLAHDMREVSHQSNDKEKERWWKSKVPPKVKHFVWKVCHTWLPTNYALSKRGISVVPTCPRCEGGWIEDGAHVLWDCSWSKEVWKTCGLWDQVVKVRSNDVLLAFQQLQKVCSPSTFDVLLVVSWHLWSVRNKYVHGGYPPKLGDMVEWCGKYVQDFQQGAGASTGVVVRDERGMVRFASATAVRFVGSPLVAELMAIREGLLAGIQRRLPRFHVQTDCLQAVRLLQGEEVGCREEDGLIMEIQRLLQHGSVSGLQFVFREVNVVAHVLANYALVNKVSAMWIGVSPPCACHAIDRDLPFPCNR